MSTKALAAAKGLRPRMNPVGLVFARFHKLSSQAYLFNILGIFIKKELISGKPVKKL